MKALRYSFCLLILSLLIVPWFTLPQPRLAGVEKQASKPSFSCSSYFDGSYQKKMDAWWNRNFGSRNTLFILKNDIYEVLNAGWFHSGAGNSVLQGTDGVIYERGYVVRRFRSYSPADVSKNAQNTTELFARLRDRLKNMGKPFCFIMAPSKADVRCDVLPPLWQFYNRFKPAHDVDKVYDIWENELRKHRITHINGLEEVRKRHAYADSFPDTGTHWSMLGAAYAVESAFSNLRSEGWNLPLISISGTYESNRDYGAEKDIARNLNLWPQYGQGRATWKNAEFSRTASGATVNTTVFGDSFTVQVHRNLAISGSSHSSTRFGNRIPGTKEWLEQLAETDVLLMVFTYPNLHQHRMKNETTRLLAMLDELILEGWHEYEKNGKGQWSKKLSKATFLNSFGGDVELSFCIKNRFQTKKLHLSLNGHELENIDLQSKKLPAVIKLRVPQEYMTRGLNSIEFRSEGAISPAAHTPGKGDARTLGVFCNEFTIRPLEKCKTQ